MASVVLLLMQVMLLRGIVSEGGTRRLRRLWMMLWTARRVGGACSGSGRSGRTLIVQKRTQVARLVCQQVHSHLPGLFMLHGVVWWFNPGSAAQLRILLLAASDPT